MDNQTQDQEMKQDEQAGAQDVSQEQGAQLSGPPAALIEPASTSGARPAAGTTEQPAPSTQAKKDDKKEEDKNRKPSEGRKQAAADKAPKAHTIALIQPSKHDSTRFYQDYTGLQEAVEGVLKLYETRLKEQHPAAKAITYDLNSLCQYMDDLKELCLLSWDNDIKAYKRYEKAWVKSSLQDLLVAAAVRK